MGRYSGRGGNRGMAVLAGCLAVVLIGLLAVAFWISGWEPAPNLETKPSTQPSAFSSTTTAPPPPPTTSTAPTEPSTYKLSTATISNTGDMLMHMPVINSAKTGAVYDFTRTFRYIQDYVTAADYAVANLETTLAGLDNGYPYHGYPNFNCPDEIAADLQKMGFDMLLTANNHTFDTHDTGFFRTQQVLEDLGLNHLGTVSSQEDILWQIQDINGIKIGMVCYTYQTGNLERPSLNGIPLSSKAKDLIGTFSYNHLGTFYAEMDATVTAMEAAGAEAVVLYIHWGDEYRTTENKYQNQIAQKMCDLGVDVIVGGHSHVVQPMELLTSTEDPSHKTVCLYSMGNAISNQRREQMKNDCPTGHTEDGVLFSFTFAKYSDGTVILESAEILPLWVNHYLDGGKYVYELIPLDKQVEDWKTQFSLTDEGVADVNASYDRTMKIVGEGLLEIQAYLQDLVKLTEETLGVK